MSQFIAYKDGLLHICEELVGPSEPAIPETIICESGELEAHAHVCVTQEACTYVCSPMHIHVVLTGRGRADFTASYGEEGGWFLAFL